MYRYTVRCEFHGDDPELVERWLGWLREPHIADVMLGGATGAEVVKMSADIPTFEIRYQFGSREAFERYERDFAPTLRDEGRQLFPPDQLKMSYQRTDGQVVFSTFR